MPNEPSTTRGPTETGETLTERELEVLALVAAGETAAAIGEKLAIKEGTVKTHLGNVYRKLGIRNRVQATRFYLERYGPRSPSDRDAWVRQRIGHISARLEELAPALHEAEHLQRELAQLRRSLA